MDIKSASFVTSAVSLAGCPDDDKFEIVLIGRSNVGKSSFINSVIRRKALARTSSTPGKTQCANYYLVNDMFYFVDMPGYGYAKVSKGIKESFNKIIKNYLSKRKTDFVVFHLIDYRHPPTENDIQIREYMRENDIYPVTVLTKEDKLKQSEKKKNKDIIIGTLEIGEDDKLFEFSTLNPQSAAEVREFIGELICSI